MVLVEKAKSVANLRSVALGVWRMSRGLAENATSRGFIAIGW